MANVIGISGSLRSGSLNTALLRAASELAPDGLTVEIASIRDIPLYDGDVEKQGLPAAVASLKEHIAGADGLLLVSPEYNNSVPGVLKNAIDWMSRPASDIKRVSGKSVFVATGDKLVVDGRLQDEKTLEVVKGYMAGFAAFVDRHRGDAR